MSRDLFGHPRGLTTLFGTEMWERFTYYGMRALFIYYLTMEVLLPGHVEHVLFYPQIKAFYEWMSGPLNVQQLSSQIYGAYTGLVFATPLLGGWIADKYLGQRKTVVIGILLMGIGQFMLTSEALLFPSLLLIIFGTGFLKTNTSAQVGMLYAAGDSRRDRAYSIFYVGINVGGAIGPLIIGFLGETYGWRWGFAAAGVGMVAALVNYIYGWRSLPAERRVESHKSAHKPLTHAEWKSVGALILLVIPVTLWWACYEQQGNTIALWAMDNTNRALIPGVIDWQIPATWFQSINSMMILAFTALLVPFWAWQAKRHQEPNSMTKMVYGSFLQTLSYLVLALAAWYTGGVKASWLWSVLFFAFVTLGELYLSPISLSLYSKVAPLKIASLMMAVNFLPNFLGGGLLQGYLGTYWTTMSKPTFFVMIAAISAIAGLIIWAMERPLRPLLQEKT
ncbi:MAG TPA: peptide MFS transporter [Rhizomicrobium sp.]|jgi:POT family proton-dependent oligopeptide transporter|nr:peptide MFS transporter [Rhizomicrobium sp.]